MFSSPYRHLARPWCLRRKSQGICITCQVNLSHVYFVLGEVWRKTRVVQRLMFMTIELETRRDDTCARHDALA